ncbi:hypothetical protein [Candidatus Mycobacterium methanotrophicum]|uniref:Uncharacterized protein n=1 Tax=Candidatus Mycobacterium methanotrophicum TaxID=2943498 RepID=A0ABY4QQK7_9MYCO|nr:hypothetical protein [Candidatus Mycobacterium methanotrophicum]UQX13362.1 hypothetical protein M5I08_16175 [Candidatus Mycobacterium methanotrophicum]
MTDRVGPAMLLLGAVMASAARNQTAHRVADQHALGDGHRSLAVQPVQYFGERSAVDRDVRTGLKPKSWCNRSP